MACAHQHRHRIDSQADVHSLTARFVCHPTTSFPLHLLFQPQLLFRSTSSFTKCPKTHTRLYKVSVKYEWVTSTIQAPVDATALFCVRISRACSAAAYSPHIRCIQRSTDACITQTARCYPRCSAQLCQVEEEQEEGWRRRFARS